MKGLCPRPLDDGAKTLLYISATSNRQVARGRGRQEILARRIILIAAKNLGGGAGAGRLSAALSTDWPPRQPAGKSAAPRSGGAKFYREERLS